jgi:c-di-GMP-binding flagellar brake protein YcgR
MLADSGGPWCKSMADPSRDSADDLAMRDRVLVEAKLADLPVEFRAVIVKLDERELWLGLASADQRLQSLQPGQIIRVTVAHESAALVGESQFLNALPHSQSRVFAVAYPATFERVERRAHVRFPAELPVHFRHLDPATAEPLGTGGNGTTVDISPAGLLFRTDAAVSLDEQLDLTLSLSEKDRISTTAHVVRVGEPSEGLTGDPGKPRLVDVAVKLTRISALDQQRIVRFILATARRRQAAVPPA